VTYNLDFARNRLGFRSWEFRVLGLRQIPADAEIANAGCFENPAATTCM